MLLYENRSLCKDIEPVTCLIGRGEFTIVSTTPFLITGTFLTKLNIVCHEYRHSSIVTVCVRYIDQSVIRTQIVYLPNVRIEAPSSTTSVPISQGKWKTAAAGSIATSKVL